MTAIRNSFVAALVLHRLNALDGSFAVLGNLKTAGGDILVIGSLCGTAAAGQTDNRDAIILALDFRPIQVKIGSVVAAGLSAVVRGDLSMPISKMVQSSSMTIWPLIPSSASLGLSCVETARQSQKLFQPTK